MTFPIANSGITMNIPDALLGIESSGAFAGSDVLKQEKEMSRESFAAAAMAIGGGLLATAGAAVVAVGSVIIGMALLFTFITILMSCICAITQADRKAVIKKVIKNIPPQELENLKKNLMDIFQDMRDLFDKTGNQVQKEVDKYFKQKASGVFKKYYVKTQCQFYNMSIINLRASKESKDKEVIAKKEAKLIAGDIIYEIFKNKGVPSDTLNEGADYEVDVNMWFNLPRDFEEGEEYYEFIEGNAFDEVEEITKSVVSKAKSKYIQSIVFSDIGSDSFDEHGMDCEYIYGTLDINWDLNKIQVILKPIIDAINQYKNGKK